MSVEAVKKIECIALNSIKEELLDILQHLGSVHIISVCDSLPEVPPFIKPAQEVSESQDTTGWLGQITSAIDYLKRYDISEKGFLDALKDSSIKVSKDEIQSLLCDFDLEELLKTCREMEKKGRDMDAQRQDVNRKLEEMESWEGLDIPLKEVVQGTAFLDFYPVLIGSEQIESFKNALDSDSLINALYEVQDLGTHKSFLLIGFKSERSKLQEYMNHYEVQIISFPSVAETSAERIKGLKQRLEEIEKEASELQKEGERLLESLNNLRILYDHYQNQEAKRKVQDLFAFTQQTFTVTGWIKEKDVDGLKKRINHLTGELDLNILDPNKNEVPPVALTNNRFSSPFELVTKLYALPHYKELDPTPILAPFFFLFFGLCLTDLGYGLIIAAVTLWGLKKLHLKKGNRGLFQLFFLCGISTVMCGLMAGSWFGDIPEYLPAWLGFLKNTKNALAIFDPIKDPLKFLLLALGLGYIQVVTGICVQMFKDIKAGDFYSAFLMQLQWVTLLTSLILLAIVKNPTFLNVLKWVSIGSALIICLCESRSERNILKRVGTGLFALYGTVGYYADMLSYCRLLALGLATAVIANVVNQIAILSMEIPYIGIILMVVIFIGGHLFNLLINLLGAFVHTIRLQFVEFFTKFFEGGGKPFIPFTRQNKYTYIE